LGCKYRSWQCEHYARQFLLNAKGTRQASGLTNEGQMFECVYPVHSGIFTKLGLNVRFVSSPFVSHSCREFLYSVRYYQMLIYYVMIETFLTSHSGNNKVYNKCFINKIVSDFLFLRVFLLHTFIKKDNSWIYFRKLAYELPFLNGLLTFYISHVSMISRTCTFV